MKLFFGTSIDKQTINDFSNYLDEPGKLKIDRFSDGEILPVFGDSIRDKKIFFIQSIYNHDLLMETLLVADAAKRAGVKEFNLVAPYISYSRQDKRDHLRSSIGSKLVADLLEKSGVTKIITIDLHSTSIEGFYNIPVIHLNGNKIFTDKLKELSIDHLTFLSPDQGAVKRTSDYFKIFPLSTFAMINKKRIKPNEIHSMELVGEVKGKNVIIIDDMADTLGTLKKASEVVMENGANSVSAICTHGILSGKAIDNLNSSKLEKLYITNSISDVCNKESDKLEVVSYVPFVSRVIASLYSKQSIDSVNSF